MLTQAKSPASSVEDHLFRGSVMFTVGLACERCCIQCPLMVTGVQGRGQEDVVHPQC